MVMGFETFLISPIPGEVGAAVGGAAVTGIGALWRALTNERNRNDANLRECLTGLNAATEANRLQNDLLQTHGKKLDEILDHVKAG